MQESKVHPQGRPFVPWCSCIRTGLHCGSLWFVSATSLTLIHYSQGPGAPVVDRISHPTAHFFFSIYFYLHSMLTLSPSWQHHILIYGIPSPLLQKAGLFIYLLKRWQQQKATSPWKGCAGACRSHGEQARSWQQSTASPFKAEMAIFNFFSPSADLLLYMPRESYISIAFLDPSPVLLLFLLNWVTALS